ncbi:hypothetical protein V7x_43420 [Crateriforma conspicua]|uniref:WD40-like Beta Propeller Repeat protein n=1 Tax=Crateriforma conspicua TaxID=2527996 RepID=A0A5C6FKS8_9PLAN|nr:hypothetical protein [Crateriforma conspicua]TWU62607.1 hypothetical protein V7x_43420 [Crateriforma conspicua]
MRLLTKTRSVLRCAILPLVLAVLSVGVTAEAQENLLQRIQSKAKEAQKLAQELAGNGNPPLEQIAKLKTIPEFGKQGKAHEIEKLLDEVLTELRGKSTPEPEDVPEYTAFKTPRKVTIRGYKEDAMEPFLSRDGQILFFNNLNDPSVNTNLHYAERIDDVTFQYKGEVGGVNSEATDGVPAIDSKNNFYFMSVRSYKNTFSTVYRGKWDAGTVSNVELVSGITNRKPGNVNFDVEVTPDGNTLYTVDGDFTSGNPPKASNFVIARRNSMGEFERDKDGDRVLAKVNTLALEYAACISKDELELIFTRAGNKSGKLTAPRLWLAARKSVKEPYGEPQLISVADGFVEGGTYTPDEKAVYYHRKDGERFVIYRIDR